MRLRRAEARKVIIHYHVFKNAGTSIDRALKEQLGDRWISFDRTDPAAKISPAEMEEFILDHPEAVAFSSHQVVPPLPDRHFEVLPIVFLRHPIDRAYSAYVFEWQVQPGAERPIGTFEQYILEKLESESRASAIEDFQTLHLANTGYERRQTPSELSDDRALANAKAFLRDVGGFGIVERYDRSVEVLNASLAGPFPGVSLRSHRENVTRNERSLEVRLEAIRSELSPQGYARLTRRNRLDMCLYGFALELFSAM